MRGEMHGDTAVADLIMLPGCCWRWRRLTIRIQKDTEPIMKIQPLWTLFCF